MGLALGPGRRKGLTCPGRLGHLRARPWDLRKSAAACQGLMGLPSPEGGGQQALMRFGKVLTVPFNTCVEVNSWRRGTTQPGQ